MHFNLFEELNLQYRDQIIIIDENGNALHGIYLGQYNRENMSFLFGNFGEGREEMIDLNKAQHINRNP